MSAKPNDATDTERVIWGIKYVGQDKAGCAGCAGIEVVGVHCSSLPYCRSQERADGRDLIFVSETREVRK